MRFVQLYDTNWDHHGGPTENLEKHLPQKCRDIDQPCAALVRDLKQRGLLDDTIVIWGGEFGRTPMGEVRESTGRNHHIDAFTMWFAGGGFKAGPIYGRPTSSASAPSRIPSTSTTSTPRSCISSASTTSSSPSAPKASTSGSPA